MSVEDSTRIGSLVEDSLCVLFPLDRRLQIDRFKIETEEEDSKMCRERLSIRSRYDGQ